MRSKGIVRISYANLPGRSVAIGACVTIVRDPLGEPLAVTLAALCAPNDVSVRILTSCDMAAGSDYPRLSALARLQGALSAAAAANIVMRHPRRIAAPGCRSRFPYGGPSRALERRGRRSQLRANCRDVEHKAIRPLRSSSPQEGEQRGSEIAERHEYGADDSERCADQNSAATPVMIAADAETIAICNAPLAYSNLSSFGWRVSRALARPWRAPGSRRDCPRDVSNPFRSGRYRPSNPGAASRRRPWPFRPGSPRR